jgi:beta-phosphoglucomutase-like phosphatase (HAD superfamily)
MTDFLMQPLFIVFDLDGTLLDVGTRQLMNGVKVSISQLKSQGHFLSVCSNNVIAKEILYELGILDQFDYIVGHASTSFKSVELLSCWAYYRYLYHTKLIRWKIHLNRIVFVDDDEENLEEVRHQFKCITAYSGIAQLLANLSDRCKPAAVSFQLVRSTIARRWGFASQVTEQRMLISRDQSVVFINATAKRDELRSGVKNTKYHCLDDCGALRRRDDVVTVSYVEAVRHGHAMCPVCAYNITETKTRKFCFDIEALVAFTSQRPSTRTTVNDLSTRK